MGLPFSFFAGENPAKRRRSAIAEIKIHGARMRLGIHGRRWDQQARHESPSFVMKTGPEKDFFDQVWQARPLWKEQANQQHSVFAQQMFDLRSSSLTGPRNLKFIASQYI
jgi:hypothetical protein